jgi:hypothetical protein
VDPVVHSFISSFLFFFKTSITFEKFVSAIPSESIIGFVGYISWHPTHSLIFLTVVIWLHLVVVAGLIRLTAFTVMNRIYYSSAFYVVSWSHIPVLLLIPVAIVLYRVLLLGFANVYISVFWIVFAFWIGLRVFKGAYVIFDIAPRRVYFVGLLVLLAVVVIFGYYFQSSYLTIDYVLQALHELKPGA